MVGSHNSTGVQPWTRKDKALSFINSSHVTICSLHFHGLIVVYIAFMAQSLGCNTLETFQYAISFYWTLPRSNLALDWLYLALFRSTPLCMLTSLETRSPMKERGVW